MAAIVSNKAVIDEYTDLARVYDRQWAAHMRAVRNWVMDRFPHDLPAGAAVIDAGCGTGHMMAAIAEEYPLHKIHGIDLTPAMCERAAIKAPRAEITTADLEHCAITPAMADVVLSLNVLHHINDADAHLQKMIAACRLGGHIFLCDYAVDGFSMRLVERHARRFGQAHARAFSTAELQEKLTALPVTVIEQEVLRPDIFWTLQIYQLRKDTP